MREELLNELTEQVGITADVVDLPAEGVYELSWDDRAVRISHEKALRYANHGELAELVRGMVLYASEKHPISPRQVLYDRGEVNDIVQRTLLGLLQEAGLDYPPRPVSSAAEAVVYLRRYLVECLKTPA